MNAIALRAPDLCPSTRVVLTRAFTPASAAMRLDTYRAARSQCRDDHEFARAHRRGLRLQAQLCARPSVLRMLCRPSGLR